MSDADRERWNARYAAGSHADRDKPCGVLQAFMHLAPPGRALDVACGAGRNALFLARHGYAVDALDISAVALQLGAEISTQPPTLDITWHCVDLLDAPRLPDQPYQLVLLCHFIAPRLLMQLPAHLAPGGVLLVEEHLQWPDPVAGPGSSRFRVAPGSLRELLFESAPELEVVHEFEGLVENDNGEPSALARLVLRRPG